MTKDSSQKGLKVLKFKYRWTISNFSLYTEPIESSVFCTGGTDKLKWKLQTNPGSGADLSPWIYVSVILVSSPKPLVSAKYILSIANVSTSCWDAKCGEEFFSVAGKTKGCAKFVERCTLSRYSYKFLIDDKLTIVCEISIPDETIDVSRDSTNIPRNVPNCRLSEDFQRLFVDQRFCDVVFDVRGKLVGAHRAILAARSPVFMTMFNAGMRESVDGNVIINDIEFEVFEAMLHHIYTGKVPNLNDLAEGLLAMADKYDLERLKAEAEEALYEKLDIENVAQIMIAADLYRSDRLKKHALEFISIRMNAASKTYGFKRMAKLYPLLTMGAIDAMAKSRGINIHSNKEEGIVRRAIEFSSKHPTLYIFCCVGFVIGAILCR